MSNTITTSKTARVLAALLDGEALTAGEMKTRYGVKNARALVSSLRMAGHAVYLNTGTKDSRGRVRASRYRIGAPSKAVVAAGYKALAA